MPGQCLPYSPTRPFRPSAVRQRELSINCEIDQNEGASLQEHVIIDQIYLYTLFVHSCPTLNDFKWLILRHWDCRLSKTFKSTLQGTYGQMHHEYLHNRYTYYINSVSYNLWMTLSTSSVLYRCHSGATDAMSTLVEVTFSSITCLRVERARTSASSNVISSL